MSINGAGRHSGGEEESLFKAGDSLKAWPASFEELAASVSARARQIREEQPMAEAVPDAMEAAAAVLRALGADAEGWYSSYAAGNEADRARLETPRRGSRTVEGRADVRAAERDGM
jgi:hypothetical protein